MNDLNNVQKFTKEIPGKRASCRCSSAGSRLGKGLFSAFRGAKTLNSLPKFIREAIIYDVISSLGVNTSQIRFHAVHRIGKKAEDRCRPIIARFVCREDRDRVWLERGKIKQSTTYPDAYITEDYARAIQEERKKLIKAMMKARDEHGLNNVKVKGRFPYIDKDRYDHENIPGFLK